MTQETIATPAPATAPADAPTQAFYRRNARAFTLDMGLWQIANSMVSGTTVLPAFAATLTQSEVLIGLVSGIGSGAWLLPQLLVASYVTRLERKRPLMVRMALLRGPIYLPVAAAAWLLSETQPGLTLTILLVGIFAFFAVDATMSIPFFDLMAQGLPERRRGRVQGSAAILGGVGGIGAGALVKHILGAWPYPLNYAALFGLGALVFLIASIALSFVQERPSAQANVLRLPVRKVLASLPQIVRRDTGFGWVILARIVGGFGGLASTFYILYAMHYLGLGPADAGLFVSAQVAGLLASGLVAGIVQDRYGPRTHVRVNMLISLLPPALALIGAGLGPGPTIRPLYAACFFLMGVFRSNGTMPYVNWILEYAAEELRPLYIGVTNTLSATLMLAPVLGGAIARYVSYPAAFVAAIVFALLGLWALTRVPDTRQPELTQPEPSR